MSRLLVQVKRSTLPVLIVLCLAALTVSYAYAEGSLRPLATVIIGDPDAAVTGKLAVGTAVPGSKALTVVGVIDFLGAGTVHNFFTQGPGNNMQIRSNVDEANAVYDATKSQWNMVMGSANNMFMIKHSPAGATYNEDALFWIEGSTGNVGIATVDTGNGAVLPFAPEARLDVQTLVGDAIHGYSTNTTGTGAGVYGRSASSDGYGVYGHASSTTGIARGVYGQTAATDGQGVRGYATATTGTGYGVYGQSNSPSGYGAYGYAYASTGTNYGVYGRSRSTSGYGVYGLASAASGETKGVRGESQSTSGTGVAGYALATTGYNYGVFGHSASTGGYGVEGIASATTGITFGVHGWTNSPSGFGVYSYGDLGANGDFSATGTKSAIVKTRDYGWRTLYTIESPQNWFEDFGQATLSGGEAVVSIEEVFAQTVNLDETYHVFLTPLGSGCTLFVDDKSSASFTVRANEGAGCEIAFDYRIIAPRLDYEDLRLKEADDPEAVAASIADFQVPEATAAP